MLSDFYKFTNIPLAISIRKLFVKGKNFTFPVTVESEKSKIYKFPLSAFEQLTTGYFRIPYEEILIEISQEIKGIAENILRHRFNLLGTGWIDRNHQLDHASICERVPYFWQPKAQEISRYLQQYQFQPINYWNAPKSKFEWDITYHRRLKPKEGVDIKEPWELGRMQHLPILAYLFGLAKTENNRELANRAVAEYQNQILDFIATNPPLYTIQWKSPMDCGIRLINWLFIYDLFTSKDAEFTDFFKKEFFESILIHINFILNNLEWSEGLRANHYFANLTALAFAGAFLPVSNFSSQLVAFSLQEIINETLHQFFEGGGNFECSTMYHLQVAEMLLLSLYLLGNLPPEKVESLASYKNMGWRATRNLLPLERQKFSVDVSAKKIIFPPKFIERVNCVIAFTKALEKANKEFDQIGDNDSGRVLRLNYFLRTVKFGNETYENLLEYPILNILTDNLNGIFSDDTFGSIFIKKNRLLSYFEFRKTEPIDVSACKEFGLYVFKSENYSLSFRCGGIGQWGKGGHSHNDQLSITLNCRGIDFIVDIGTYCYTCSVEARNRFRSVISHNTLVVPNKEQNTWKTNNLDDVFWISKHRTKSKIIQINKTSIIGEQYAYRQPHRRCLAFEPNKIWGEDLCLCDGEKHLHFHLHPNVTVEIKNNLAILQNANIKILMIFEDSSIGIEEYEYSPQYGLLIASKRIVYTSHRNQLRWRLEL